MRVTESQVTVQSEASTSSMRDSTNGEHIVPAINESKSVQANIAERIEHLGRELAGVVASRAEAQRQLDDLARRASAIAQRMSAAQVAKTVLAGLPDTAFDERLVAQLTTWRQVLCDELLQLPRRSHEIADMGRQRNLVLSVQAIDLGPDVTSGTGYDLTTLRLGQLMRAAGHEPAGADPERNYVGKMPWFGTLPEVESRIADVRRQQDDAERQLADALLDDGARAQKESEARTRRDALNAAPVRKVRGDGSRYDKYPDGRVVEVID